MLADASNKSARPSAKHAPNVAPTAHITPLPFDTHVLGVYVARAEGTVTTTADLQSIGTVSRALGADVVYVTLDAQSQLDTGALGADTLYQCPPSVTWHRNLSDARVARQGRLGGAPSCRIDAVSACTDQLDAVKQLAVVAGHHSRFFCDPHLTDAQFTSMYHAWAANSVNRSAASHVLGAFDEADRIVGVVTIKLSADKRSASIGLLAVSPECQRGGVGADLMAGATAWAVDQGVASLTVDTQATNSGAMAFYERRGFVEAGRRYVGHLWLGVKQD